MAGCADYQMATGITFPLLTIGGAVAQQYGVDRQYLVIDGDGIVRGSFEGIATDQELADAFEAISGT